MVRIASFALVAGLLLSAPTPSFAEAAPAPNVQQLPRQTLKPRYAHTYPKHIKRREFQNTTTPTPPPQPKSTPVEVAPTTKPPAVSSKPSKDNSGTTSGILGGAIPGIDITLPSKLGDGAGVDVTGPHLTVDATVPGLTLLGAGEHSSSSAPVTKAPETRSASAQSQGQSQSRSAGLDSLLNPNGVISDVNSLAGGLAGAGNSAINSAISGVHSFVSAAESSLDGDLSSLGLAGDKSTKSADATQTGANTQTAPAQSPSASPNTQSAPAQSQSASPNTQSAGPSLSSPDGNTPTQPGGIIPTLSIPPLSVPTLSIPPLSIPTLSIPTLSIPDPLTQTPPTPPTQTAQPVTNPDPNTGVPTLTIPTIAIPTISIPTIAIPTISVPTIAIPTISIPTIAIPTFTPPQDTGTPTPILTLPITLPTLTDSPITLPTPTVTDLPITVSVPTNLPTDSPTQPTAPLTMTVIPVPATSQSPSQSPQTQSAPPASSASAAPETLTQPASSAPAQTQSQPQPQTQTPSAAPATTEQPAPSSITAPATVPVQTQAAPTSVIATGSDTQTQVYVPTSLVIDTATTVQPPASTAAFSTNGIPSTMPHVIPPPDSNGILPPAPINSKLIQIGFKYQLNYPFVLQHKSAIFQIFDILPKGLAFGLSIDSSNITMQSLQPYDTTRTQGFITTVALAYIPESAVGNLTAAVPNSGSMLYKNTNDTRHALMSVIDPTFPVLAGIGLNAGDGTSGGNPATTSTIVDQGNPLDQAQAGTSVNGTAVGIGVGVCAGAAVYGAAMFFLAKRYKQRKSRHSRSSSMIDTASMVNSTHEQQTGAGTALMSNGPEGSYGTRGGSRNSNGSGGSSHGRGEISAPVMAENSLGWN